MHCVLVAARVPQVVPAVPLHHTHLRVCLPLFPACNSHLLEHYLRAIAARWNQRLTAGRDCCSRSSRARARCSCTRRWPCRTCCSGAPRRRRPSWPRRWSPTRQSTCPGPRPSNHRPEPRAPSRSLSYNNRLSLSLVFNKCKHLHASDFLINPSSPISDCYNFSIKCSFLSSSSGSLPFLLTYKVVSILTNLITHQSSLVWSIPVHNCVNWRSYFQ